MAYRFHTKTVGAYTDHVAFLNGDPDKITNPDRSVEVGRYPPLQSHATYCGRPIDPTHLPTRLQPKGRRKKMPDLLGTLAGMLCSEKVRKIVEEFEPGVHAFYPVVFEWKNGQQDEGHYIWIVQNSIKALHPDLIDPPYPGPNERWNGLSVIDHPNGKAVFSKEKIGNAHIWSDPQLWYAWFMSDALAEAFFAADVTGFDPRPHVAVV